MKIKQSEVRAQLLASLPEVSEILVSDGEHGYRRPRLRIGTALKATSERGEVEWTEDYGEQLTPEAKYGKRVRVLIVD